MKRLCAIAAAVALALGCASGLSPRPAERLYFALELREQGRLVARPQLLGETDKLLRAERRQPGQDVPDYRLALRPHSSGQGFKVELDLQLPSGDRHSQLALLHGEARKLQLGNRPGELEVSLLLMRVDSPEFRALMDLPAPTSAQADSI